MTLHPSGTSFLLRRPIGKVACILACVLVSILDVSQPVQAQTTIPEQLFQEAVAAQQRGEEATAVAKYRELLRLHPEVVEARLNLGTTLAHMKRFREAIEQYKLILVSDMNNRPARLKLAIAYEGNGDLPSAMRELEQLHRDDSSDAQASLLLADGYMRADHEAEAVIVLAPLEQAHPNDGDVEWLLGSALIHTGHLQEGVERVEKVAESAASADAYMLAGQTRLAMSQYDLARRDADAAQRLNPKLAGLQTLSGMILEQSGNYDDAEAALLQSLAENSNDFNAHYYLGAIYYFKRDTEKAHQHLARALTIQPSSDQARYEMALVARAEGHPDAALKDLETVVRQTPAWLEPHVELSALYYRLHRNEDGAREKQIVDRMMAAQQQSQANETTH